ncbi:MAG: hypothetical protein NUV49_03540 [Patescibacteria group bacterium]|nr:hypothetical protein [Patescibacteria group bacterium]
MGHSCIAGELYEQAIGGETFIRVDVPDVTTKRGELKGYSKLYGKGAIYAITPTDEMTCRLFITANYTPPISPYSFPALPEPKEHSIWENLQDFEDEENDLPFDEMEN